MKTTIKQLQAELRELHALLESTKAERDVNRASYRSDLEKRESEIREIRDSHRSLGKDLENAETEQLEAERALASHRALVLEYFMAMSNCVTRDNTPYMMDLSARVCGHPPFHPPQPADPSRGREARAGWRG